MWDGAYVYETDESAAYSIAWNDADLTPDAVKTRSNPNNNVNIDKPFPPNCPGVFPSAEVRPACHLEAREHGPCSCHCSNSSDMSTDSARQHAWQQQ